MFWDSGQCTTTSLEKNAEKEAQTWKGGFEICHFKDDVCPPLNSFTFFKSHLSLTHIFSFFLSLSLSFILSFYLLFSLLFYLSYSFILSFSLLFYLSLSFSLLFYLSFSFSLFYSLSFFLDLNCGDTYSAKTRVNKLSTRPMRCRDNETYLPMAATTTTTKMFTNV